MPSVPPFLDPVRVEKLIKSAKAEAVAFAFALGATPDASLLAADKSKAGKALYDIARKEARSKKGAYGTVQMVETTAVFTCLHSDVPTLRRDLLAHFKLLGISAKIEVTDPPADLPPPSDETPEEPNTPTPEPSATVDRQTDEPETVEQETEDDDAIPEGKMFDPAVILPLLRKARTKARPFAFGVGDDQVLLAVHPRLEPMRLAKDVRGAGAKRGVWGTVILDGAVLVFTCEKKPFGDVKKGLRRWFAEQKLKVKFRVMGPDGEHLEDEDQEGAQAPIQFDRRRFESARNQWNDAIDEVNQQLNALAARLRQSSDPRLHDIAEFGLAKIMAGHHVPLRAALLDVAGANTDQQGPVIAKTINILTGFENHLSSHPYVDACEKNPFGVTVQLRATLNPALKGLRTALTA